MKQNKIYRRLKLFFIRLARTRASTNEISNGAAIGTFVSVFPTFGVGLPTVILMSRFFRFNLMAAIALSVVSNPFTSPFFMVLSYKVGSKITGSTIAFSLENWKENLSETGLILLIGSLIVSGISSIIAYFSTKYIVTTFRSKSKHTTK